ncbi:hypothetical protein FB107DRAFT_287083 [Schizophyllum commune]
MSDAEPIIYNEDLEDSEDDFDWEEVPVPEPAEQEIVLEEDQSAPQNIEITIRTKPKKNAKADIKKQGISHAERLLRVDCHKLHTLCLLASARVRNKWLNDPLLHARLLSLTPLELQNAFSAIHKSRMPDANHRAHMFRRALEGLVEWWADEFFDVKPEGHIRNRTFAEVQKYMIKHQVPLDDPDATMDLETLEDVLDDEGETIRSPKSLMKHVLMHSGSRDMSAQLFTALCRALGLPARLVVSIQSVPWQTKDTSSGSPAKKKQSKGKGKQKATEYEDDGEVSAPGFVNGAFPGNGQSLAGSSTPMSEKAKGKQRAEPQVKLRKGKSKGQVLGKASTPTPVPADPLSSPPVFWTEVFSRTDGRWIPIDPIRNKVNRRKAFDPSPPTAGPKSTKPERDNIIAVYNQSQAPTTPARRVGGRPIKEENRMLYVVAFEEDGYARDVTRRYAHQYLSKVMKAQGGSKQLTRGKNRIQWWEGVMGLVTRPYRLHRDDMEDEELNSMQMSEGMPTTLAGFKDHPLYVLERHIRQHETIHPPPPATPELGKFRGESVYPRSNVVSLKSAENWMRSEGRTVKAGEQPMKFVKLHANTVARLREIELAKDELRVAGADSAGDLMQGLYARSQTEMFVPPPVVDGKIPKNNFGNVDLFVPNKGVVKIARKLGFDYAEALTGFEFKKRRAVPVIQGVVIAVENEQALLEAYWEAEQDAAEKARVKREERVLKLWTRLVQGLTIRARLQEQYADRDRGSKAPANEPPPAASTSAAQPEDDDLIEVELPDTGGGYLVGADDVVQSYHLPKAQYAAGVPREVSQSGDDNGVASNGTPAPEVILQTMELDEADTVEAVAPAADRVAPRTMEALAADSSRAQSEGAHEEDEDILVLDGPVNAHANGVSQANGAGSRGSSAGRRTRKAANGATAANGEASTNGKAPAKRAAGRKRGRKAIEESEGSEDEKPSRKRTNTRKRASPAKASATAETGGAPAAAENDGAPAAAETPARRSLRPRKTKTAEQIEQEREAELAYRRAIADSYRRIASLLDGSTFDNNGPSFKTTPCAVFCGNRDAKVRYDVCPRTSLRTFDSVCVFGAGVADTCAPTCPSTTPLASPSVFPCSSVFTRFVSLSGVSDLRPIKQGIDLFTSVYLFSDRETFLAYISVRKGDLFCHSMLGELLSEKNRKWRRGWKIDRRSGIYVRHTRVAQTWGRAVHGAIDRTVMGTDKKGRTGFDDTTAWADSQVRGYESDVGQVEDLRAVGKGHRPQLGLGIVDFSQEARWIYMTDSVTDLLGWEPRELVGRPSLELVHPDEFLRVRKLHYDTITEDKAAVLAYLRMRHKDPYKGYVLCGIVLRRARTVVHNVLMGSVSFARPGPKQLHNASTATEIEVITPAAKDFQFRRWNDPTPMPPSPGTVQELPTTEEENPAAWHRRSESRSPSPRRGRRRSRHRNTGDGSSPDRHGEPSSRSPSPKVDPSVSFDPLPNQSFRTAFIVDRFSLSCPIMYYTNDHFIETMEILGRSFYDFVSKKDESLVRSWIDLVKSWGVNERGQPSDGGFGFGRFRLLTRGRKSAEAEPADRRRTSMSRARQTSRQPKPKSVSRSRPVIQTDAHLADNQPIHQRGDRSQTHPYTYVDAIFSAHSDGLMIILRGCPNVKQPLPPTSSQAAGPSRPHP